MSSNRRKAQVLQPVMINQSRLDQNDGFIRINRALKPKTKPQGKADGLSKENQHTTDKASDKTHEVPATCTPRVESQPESAGAVGEKQTTEQDEYSTDQMISWMTSIEPSSSYWKVLAEERRVALAEALAENEDLSEQLEIAEKHIEILQAENEALKETANEAQVLAGLLQGLLDDKVEETE